MWLEPFFSNAWYQDVVASVITFGVALVWLRSMDALAHRGIVEQRLSRKIIHIGTGPLFVLCWNFFSGGIQARYLAALVPLSITIQFILVGLGLWEDPAAVQAMTRTSDPREILRGPLLYGLVFIASTVIFWRHSPVGILSLMLMCGGDGLADVVGRKWGATKLPFNPGKSWIGSAAMFLGGFTFAFAFLALFNALGQFQPALHLATTTGKVALVALVATVVEALPLRDVDNLTVTAVAVGLGLWML